MLFCLAPQYGVLKKLIAVEQVPKGRKVILTLMTYLTCIYHPLFAAAKVIKYAALPNFVYARFVKPESFCC